MHLGRCLSLALLILIVGSLLTFSIGLIFFSYFGIVPFPLSQVLWPSVIVAVVAFILYIVFSVGLVKYCRV